MDWDKAYRDHHGMVFAFLYHRSRGNRELSRDLTQDVFVRAMRAQHQFTDRGAGVEPWLITIARNLLVDHIKSAQFQREYLHDDMRDADRQLPSAEDLVLRSEQGSQVRAAMRALTATQREALLLHYWQGLSMVQIGARQYCSDSAVKAVLRRARQSLSRQLAEVA